MQICFLCFYDIIWDIIFPTTFKVIWYRAWSNCARTHYICIDCWYLARVFWDPGTLHSARTTIQGVDWCSACSVPTLVTLCVRTRIQFPLSCKNRNSSQWLVNQGKTCPEHYFWYFYFCDAVLKHLFGRLEPCLDYRTIFMKKRDYQTLPSGCAEKLSMSLCSKLCSNPKHGHKKSREY